MQRKVEKPSCCFCAQHETSKKWFWSKIKESILFIRSYAIYSSIKALGMPSGNLPNPPEQKESFEQSEEIDLNNSELEPQPSSPFQPPLTPTLSSPSIPLYTSSTTDMSQKKNIISPSQSEPSPSCVSNKKRGLKNEAVDKAFLEYFLAKKKSQNRELFALC